MLSGRYDHLAPMGLVDQCKNSFFLILQFVGNGMWVCLTLAEQRYLVRLPLLHAAIVQPQGHTCGRFRRLPMFHLETKLLAYFNRQTYVSV